MAANKVFWWVAPKGYKAVACREFVGTHPMCFGCFMYETDIPCPEHHTCISKDRKDGQPIIFIKRENHV